ncbi:uncharacterized protein LOC135113570 isoform X2 [Scylla paramamosain]|uniref:uncharacterized protein LOC135113570 isoform X2 n=1 Tax=Scylla paramamosain TaxID=85552 RepID=UPI0030835232
MEDAEESVSSSQVEEKVRDFLHLVQEEQKMAVLYIVLVLLFFSASLIILLVRHVRREKETRKMERFYRDYLLTTYSRPVVYFDKRGRPLQEKGLTLPPSRPQGAGPDATSTSSESDIVASSRPSVSAPAAAAAAAAPPSESSGTYLAEIIGGTKAGNCFCDATRHLSSPVTPGAPVDGTVPAAGHTNAPGQLGNVAPSTVTREGAKTECDTALFNATLAPTLPPPEKCIECDNTSIEVTAVHDNTCELSLKELSATTQAPGVTATQCKTKNSPFFAKLSGKSTSV